MKELTPTVKQQITRDWNALFPDLAVYESMHLLRRVGPLLTGILLERDSSNRSYRPTFHVHNLCVERPRPFVSLTLHCELRTSKGAAETIDVRDHENKYKEAAQRLTQQALLPFGGDLTIAQVYLAYRKYLARGGYYAIDPDLYCDMALISAWAGCMDEAEAILGETRVTMEKWPKAVIDQMGGLEAWRAQLSAAISDPDRIKETAARQLVLLKAQDLPESKLLV